jgi:hypothetical protein
MATQNQFGWILEDVTVLESNLDRIWMISQTLPLGDARDGLELAQQCAAQQSLNMKKTLAEMLVEPQLVGE